jgi:hypothetical protein
MERSFFVKPGWRLTLTPGVSDNPGFVLKAFEANFKTNASFKQAGL